MESNPPPDSSTFDSLWDSLDEAPAEPPKAPAPVAVEKPTPPRPSPPRPSPPRPSPPRPTPSAEKPRARSPALPAGHQLEQGSPDQDHRDTVIPPHPPGEYAQRMMQIGELDDPLDIPAMSPPPRGYEIPVDAPFGLVLASEREFLLDHDQEAEPPAPTTPPPESFRARATVGFGAAQALRSSMGTGHLPVPRAPSVPPAIEVHADVEEAPVDAPDPVDPLDALDSLDGLDDLGSLGALDSFPFREATPEPPPPTPVPPSPPPPSPVATVAPPVSPRRAPPPVRRPTVGLRLGKRTQPPVVAPSNDGDRVTPVGDVPPSTPGGDGALPGRSRALPQTPPGWPPPAAPIAAPLPASDSEVPPSATRAGVGHDAAGRRTPVPGSRDGGGPPTPGRDRGGSHAPGASPQSDPAPSSLADRVLEMTSLFEAQSWSSALVIAESVLVGDPGHEEARRCAAGCREMLAEKYLTNLGGRANIPRVAMGAEELRWLALDHRAGFLLSFIDGSMSLDEVLDVCSMPELDALRIMFELRMQGAIEIVEPNRRPGRRPAG